MDWEKLGRAVARTGREVSEKVKDSANLVALQQKQLSAKSQLEEVYSEIGKICYDRSGGDAPEGMEDLFRQVSELKEEIRARKEEIGRLKGTRKCPNCGAEVPSGAKYCGRCGAEIREDAGAAETSEEAAGSPDGAETAAAENPAAAETGTGSETESEEGAKAQEQE